MKLRNLFLISAFILGASTCVTSSLFFDSIKEVEVKASIPEGLYDAAESAVANRNWPALYEALKTASNTGYDGGSYASLWDWYKTTDIRSDGKIKDWYSDDTNFTPGSKQCGNYSKIGDCYNREHSIPKSWWGGSKSNQGCDIYIVVPTDGKINNTRGNDPFGIVDPSIPQDASEVGKNKYGSAKSGSGISGTVFEPFDSVKGDFARVYFYAVCKWSSVSMTSGEGSKCFQSGTYSSSNNYGLTNYAKNLFYSWHKLDPVDDFEINRNNYGQSTQGNRNPFVDHPEYVEYLWGNGEPTPVVDPTSVEVTPSSANVNFGDSLTLNAKVLPSQASQSVTWTSSDTTVATVNNGVVTAKQKLGTATITASSVKAGIVGTSIITVTAPTPVNVTSVNASDITLDAGAKKDINATYLPTNAYPKPTLTYTSNDTSVAVVGADGKVTGVKEGSTNITIRATQVGGGDVSNTIKVTVNPAGQYTKVTDFSNLAENDKVVITVGNPTNKPQGITGWNGNKDATLSNNENEWVQYEVKKNGSSINLYDSGAQAYIATPGGNEFKYTTSDSNIGSVSIKDDYFTCGSRYLGINGSYCRFYTSLSSYTGLNVYKKGSSPEPVDYITLDKSSVELEVGQSSQVNVVEHSGNVTWESLNPSIASVNNGLIKAISEGNAVIRAKCGTAYADVNVVVSESPVVDFITLKTKSLELKVNEIGTIEVESASGPITWTSSDSSIATVNDGKVTAIKEGEVTITATVGTASASVSVKVSNAPVPPTPTPEDHSGAIVPAIIVGSSVVVAGGLITLFIIVGRKRKIL